MMGNKKPPAGAGAGGGGLRSAQTDLPPGSASLRLGHHSSRQALTCPAP